MRKIGKIDYKKVAMNAVISAGTGAVAQVASDLINMTDPQNTDYIMIGAGIILPEIVKGATMETVGTALTAVGAYRLAERNDLGGKLGFGTPVAATAGLQNNIGRGWNPEAKNVYASKVTGKKSEAGPKSNIQ